MRCSLLAGRYNVQSFSINPADCDGLHPVLLPWWDDYECPHLLFVPTLLVFSYYGDLFLQGGSDDIRRTITLAIYEFVILAGVLFLLYAAEGAAVD